ncbi:hypothetical protein Tco_1135363 [Tanacetum coccineum]
MTGNLLSPSKCITRDGEAVLEFNLGGSGTEGSMVLASTGVEALSYLQAFIVYDLGMDYMLDNPDHLLRPRKGRLLRGKRNHFPPQMELGWSRSGSEAFSPDYKWQYSLMLSTEIGLMLRILPHPGIHIRNQEIEGSQVSGVLVQGYGKRKEGLVFGTGRLQTGATMGLRNLGVVIGSGPTGVGSVPDPEVEAELELGDSIEAWFFLGLKSICSDYYPLVTATSVETAWVEEFVLYLATTALSNE